MFRSIFFLVLLVFTGQTYAQEDAWVYLTDKPNVSEALANPSSILTQKAIARKQRHGIPIDARDVPVNEAYISQLKSQTGITVLAKSKWFNSVYVRGISLENIKDLSELPFVDAIDFADTSLNTSTSRTRQVLSKTSVEDTRVDFTYGDSQNQVEMINVDALHTAGYTGKGITIAVLDSGFPNVNTMQAFQRLRDQGNLLGGYDFVDRTEDIYANTTSSHGTLVLSSMAAYIENEYVGTAPDASYYIFNTEDPDSESPAEESYWVEATERADSLGVDMINTSLGYNLFDNAKYNYTTADMNGKVAFISKGASIAVEKGILVVVSAGNSGATSWRTVTAPADSPDILSIGAVNAFGEYVSFSSQGGEAQVGYQKPDVVARGGATFLVNENDQIVQYNGTSFSSPIMCGGIASLWQSIPEVSATMVMNLVRESGSQYSNPDDFLGYGIPDLALAKDFALSINDDVMEAIRFYPNPVSTVLNLVLPSSLETLEYAIYNQLGQQVSQHAMQGNSKTIDVSGLSHGVYILKLSSRSNSKSFKFIK
ncbi:S8 family serine peptidase [Formosa sp. 4Alg 33]|uniref:S8 family serine peptidase n=1 Tax=Formosa sp. 4Alg 33 TaxID=3382189 RepID=UPI003D9BFFBD